MKNIKRLAIYSTIGVLALTNLTGCSGKAKGDSEETVVEEELTEEEISNEFTALEQLQEEVKEGDTKTFEPYQHLFFIRVDLLGKNTNANNSIDISTGDINIPEGYKVFEIENFSSRYQKGTMGGTMGYDIWFTNEIPVEVTAIYNEPLKKYDYSHFGIPVVEKENEGTIQKTK